jgi:hypothetical protein
MTAPLMTPSLMRGQPVLADPLAAREQPDASQWSRELQRARREAATVSAPAHAFVPFTEQVVAFLEGFAEVTAHRESEGGMLPGDALPVPAAVPGEEGLRGLACTPDRVPPDAVKAGDLPAPGNAGHTHPHAADGGRKLHTTQANARTATRLTPPVAAETPTPVRVHADWSEQGVRVWLGIDGAAAGSAPMLARQLQRWLGSQGIRTLSITCNGKCLSHRWSQPGGPALPPVASGSYDFPASIADDKEPA